MDVMRAADLNCAALSTAQRAELYQEAEHAGLLIGIPERVRPMTDPLIQMNPNAFGKILYCRNIVMDPDSSDRDRTVACYAFHVWRERTDTWEINQGIWSHGGKYSPSWKSEMWKESQGLTLYDTFISAFELERYIVNPWIRSNIWLNQQNLDWMDLSQYRPLGGRPGGRKNRPDQFMSSARFISYNRQIPQWWVNQKESKIGAAGMGFTNVKDLANVLVGLIPTAEWGVEGWDGGSLDRYVRRARECFSWEEYAWRLDECNMMQIAITIMLNSGKLGASYGSLVEKRMNLSARQLWTVEDKLLTRLRNRVNIWEHKFLKEMESTFTTQMKWA